MEKPVTSQGKSIAVPVKKGETYYWCTCGKSSNQPLCIGSHKGTSFEPLAFTAEKDEIIYLCTCEPSKNVSSYDETEHIKEFPSGAEIQTCL